MSSEEGPLRESTPIDKEKDMDKDSAIDLSKEIEEIGKLQVRVIMVLHNLPCFDREQNFPSPLSAICYFVFLWNERVCEAESSPLAH